ncbi:MAG: hypothetical protein PHI68_00265 [Candidatus Cloacimonetes bacterium]|nr:hypothetical protein [Candidatus Cloacimonadota bacterium]
MNEDQNREDLLSIFLQEKKVKLKMAKAIREEIWAGEEPLDYGTFYRGASYFHYSLAFIICLNLGYLFLEGILKLPVPLALCLTVLTASFFLWLPHLDHVGILITNKRLIVVSNLFKQKRESISHADISVPKLGFGYLQFKIRGKRRSFAMNSFSKMYWNERKKKGFQKHFEQAINRV